MSRVITTSNDEMSRNEPIAIIGMGCRFPGGANSPTAFWHILQNGVDAIVDVPPDRWDMRRFYDPDPDKPGKMYIRQAGFLQERIDEFDAQFFGMAPRQAAVLDPQQRLLLEVTWEGVEDAGLSMEQLNGSNTGIYMGGFALDGKLQQMGVLNREIIMSHTATSASMVMLSNRISYIFDLQGPSFTVDTACSSSLVALHLACQALWNQECELAISGGVNVMFRPEYTITMCKGGFLSPDARCKTFDERADGYARGEGAGVVVLKPLAAALADGDRIYAMICATGINQDGRTQGITVPNGASQQRLIHDVCQKAGISPSQIQYVEAHGTGTQAGDSVEANSLGAVLSHHRAPDDPCWVGSVKTNIGHLEAAAGIAGVIKTVLSLQQQAIPPHLHLTNPNPKIDFDTLNLRVPQRMQSLSNGSSPIYAGVNSFGYGGTNAHAILRSAPQALSNQINISKIDGPFLLPFSAQSKEALTALSGAYKEFIASAPAEKARSDLFTHLCYTAATRRTHHAHRLALVANNLQEASQKLEAFLSGEAQLATGHLLREKKKVVFVYTGMGAQWWGMGCDLLDKEPVFRETLERCDQIWQGYAGWSLLELFTFNPAGSEGKERLSAYDKPQAMSAPQFAQPANFALQVALTALWRSYGLEPDAVVGHSVGEISAAYVAGTLSLDDALRLTYYRSQFQEALAGKGTMLAVGASVDQVRLLLSQLPRLNQTISIAAVNSSNSVTLAGEENALHALAALLEEKRIFNRFLKVDVAYHSYQLDPLEDAFMSALSDLVANEPNLPLYSTVTGHLVREEKQDVSYWWRNARQPVLLANTLERLISDGYDTFLEVGPHPVLAPSIQQSLHEHGKHDHGITVPSLRRTQAEQETMLTTLGKLYSWGCSVAWERLYPKGQVLSLPTYPWQRERLWYESDASRVDRLGNDGHPLLQSRLSGPQPTWQSELNEQFLPFLHDHRVQGTVVFPGAGYVEAGLALAGENKKDEPVVLEELSFDKPLMPEKAPLIQIKFDEETGRFSIHSRAEASWVRHVTGRVMPHQMARHTGLNFDAIRQRCPHQLKSEELYTRLNQLGLQYGPHFQTMQQIWLGDGEFLADLQLHPSSPPLTPPNSRGGTQPYRLHPTLLDGCFQSFVAMLEAGEGEQSGAFVPVSIKQVRFHAAPGSRVWGYGRMSKQTNRFLEGDLILCNESGEVLVELFGLRCQALGAAKGADSQTSGLHNWLYAYRWEQIHNINNNWTDIQGNGSRWLVFADQTGIGRQLATLLEARGAACMLVSPGPWFDGLDASHFQIAPDSRADMEQLLHQVSAETLAGVIYLWGMDEPRDDKQLTGMADSVTMLHLVQSLAQSKLEDSFKLALITCRAQVVTAGESPHEPRQINRIKGVGQSALWGLGRVIANEHPELGCMLIDMDGMNSPQSWSQLVRALLGDRGEPELALRGSDCYVNRLDYATERDWQKNRTATERKTAHQTARPDTPFVLTVAKPGLLDSLTWQETERRSPEAGEIEIELHAAPLNFKDLMKVMNLLSEEYLDNTFFGQPLGAECAGVVVRVGEGVDQFRIGDSVVAPEGGGCFRSYHTVRTLYAVPKPTPFSFEESVIFINFIAPYYGLHHIARLQAGEKVLIHSATGGVGLAAIQIAQWRGAEIYATAGSEEKRAYLRSLGINYVSDSRSLQFVDDILAWTDGEGVDVVLNTLSGEALKKSFALLAPYGRFIELGKRDIHDNSQLAMAAFDRNLLFAAVDIDLMMAERPKLFRKLLDEVCQHCEDGTFKPLPMNVFPATRVEEAFRYMAQAKHIGKIALQMHQQEVPLQPKMQKAPTICVDGTYLITGGFGGFGLEVAKWLVKKGARHLVLVSRRGPVTSEAHNFLDKLKKQDVQVTVAKADVSIRADVSQLIQDISSSMPPLRGLIHAAMVLDDSFMLKMDKTRFENVMAPKVLGAWHLHEQTQRLPLDFFILFSSVSALIGNPGQANYVAANAFLDGLAHYRRLNGCPAMSINWGVLSQVGVVARNPEVERYFERMGITGFTPQEAVAALDQLLEEHPAQVGVMKIDWSQFANSPLASAPRYRELLASATEQSERYSNYPFIDTLLATSAHEWLPMIDMFLREQLSKVFQLPAARIESHKGLDQLGIDSLMAVELQNSIRIATGVEFTTMQLLNGPTIDEMSQLLLDNIDGMDGIERPVEELGQAEDSVSLEELEDVVDELSDEEVEQLLMQILEETDESS